MDKSVVVSRVTNEETLERKANKSKDAVKLKYFKQFCNAKTFDERLEIDAKMKVLEAVIYDLIKDIKAIDK